MAPIINPWFIYTISTLDQLRNVSNIILFLFVAVSGFLLFIGILMSGICTEELEITLKRAKMSIKHFGRYLLIIISISIACNILIPSSKTMYNMLIAYYVTPNNIESVRTGINGEVSDLVNILTGSINSVIKEVKK